jgi:hypothetical protein
MPGQPSSCLEDPSQHPLGTGKNLYIVEYGSVEGEAGRKGEWFDAARATMKSWPEIVGASYINENTDCNFLVNTSNSSLSRFRAMGSDSSFQR